MLVLTTSIGKAAAGINSATVHSAFNLSISKSGKQCCYRKSLDAELHEKHHLYIYLNTLMLDKVSMIGNKMSEHLNLSLQNMEAMPKVYVCYNKW